MATVKDPVCGATIETERAPYRSSYLGDTYYFCAFDCMRRFDEHPAQYTTRREAGRSGRRE